VPTIIRHQTASQNSPFYSAFHRNKNASELYQRRTLNWKYRINVTRRPFEFWHKGTDKRSIVVMLRYDVYK